MNKPVKLSFILFILAGFLFKATFAYALEQSLDQGLDEIARKVTKSIPEGAKKTVAVMDFNSLDGSVTMLGRFVSEELITKLFETERFKVIERSLLNKAIEELKFNTTDLVDPTIAKQVGKVVGADAIVTGTISDLNQSVKINARIITVESGEVIGASGTQVVKDITIKEMLSQPLNSKETDSKFEAKSNYAHKHTTETDISKIGNKVEARDFTFEVTDCSISADIVTCDFFITSNGKDRNLTLFFGDTSMAVGESSRMIDGIGNVYYTSQERWTGNVKTGALRKYVSAKFINGVQTKVSVHFENVSKEIKEIALLELLFNSDKRFTVQFRDIPVSK